jgi:hypothetical protein
VIPAQVTALLGSSGVRQLDPMKIRRCVARITAVLSGEIDEPVEKLRPFNWLIRRVCG